MKTKLISIFGFASIMILMASCNKDNDTQLIQDDNTPASMTITIGGDNSKLTRITGTPTQAEENAIHEYTVYVFNANTNKLQKSETFTSNLTNTISGLTVGPKKVVVIANLDEAGEGILNLNVGDDYSEFDNTANMLDIQSQVQTDLATKGLVMSGEAEITLNSGHNTMASPLKIKRVVAKVKVGTVSVEPVTGHEGDFSLNYVYIMKGRGQATLGPVNTITGDDLYGGSYGGFVSQLRPFYADYLTTTDFDNRYFYVYPNDNRDDNATLLTLEGVYEGKQVFFPIRINDQIGTGGSTTNGNFVERNGQYTINIVIKRPGDGSGNPEVPVDPATLEITVEAEDWATELIQNVEI